MRVAFLDAELDPNYGWARYGLELASALSACGAEVVALTQPGARVAPGAHLADVRPVLPQLMPRPRLFVPRSLAAIPPVRRALAGCDVVHVIAEPYSVLGAAAAGARPLVVTAHGTYVPQTVQRRWVGGLYRWAYHRAHLIAVSDYTAGRVRAVLPDVDLTVIKNGVHFERFQARAPAPVKRGPTILATGGVKPRKGTLLLAEALAQVRQQIPDAQLVVTGNSEAGYAEQVQLTIKRLGLEDAVHLVGMLPEDALRGWYQQADVFALPSINAGAKFEGFGLVFLEASAAGLPVVGTRGSGVEEALIEGETGLLVPQHDAHALADAIVRLLTDPALRARLGAAGRAYAQTQDWQSIAERVLALYTQLLK